MRPCFLPLSPTARWRLRVAVAVLVASLSTALFLYPSFTILRMLADGRFRRTGELRQIAPWFRSVARRYAAWADGYLRTEYATKQPHDAVAPTEWPMFGSVFFLVTAEDLHREGIVDAARGSLREAVDKAVQIVMSPATATWVRTKWGDGYLDRENVFYRMLLVMGTSSYESITGDLRHRSTMSRQRRSLAAELEAAKYHLREDYPGECYPTDVLWAVAAIQRAARLEGTNHNALAASLMATFDGPLLAPEGLPAFQVDSRSGELVQDARGCANSGILQFAAELDADTAARWYGAHVEHFWKANRWLAGFSEMPRDSADAFSDVDSGPVIAGLGSVASAFGIGAARSVGRLDQAVPLTLEAVACAWPTPFGFVIPGLMGKVAVDGWCLGEVALLFSMTRPIRAAGVTPFQGPAPRIVLALALAHAMVGVLFIALEVRGLRRGMESRKASR